MVEYDEGGMEGQGVTGNFNFCTLPTIMVKTNYWKGTDSGTSS